MGRVDDLLFNMSISEASKKSSDEKITFDVCTSKLNKMFFNKSPWNDSLSLESFSPDIGNLVLDSFDLRKVNCLPHRERVPNGNKKKEDKTL